MKTKYQIAQKVAAKWQQNRSKQSSFRLSDVDKRVVKAFLDKRKADGRVLSTDGSILVKEGLGGERIARWRKDHIAVLSKEGVKSDQVILRYLEKLSRVPVRYSYQKGDTQPSLDIRLEVQGYHNRQMDAVYKAFVPGIDKPVGKLHWSVLDAHEDKYFIQNVWVHPDWRRKGVAKAMYKRLFKDENISKDDLQPSYRTDEGAAFRKHVNF